MQTDETNQTETPPSAEELKQASDQMVAAFFSNNPPPKEKEKEPEPAPEPTQDEPQPEPETKDEPEQPAEPASLGDEPAPEPDPAVPPALDEEELVDRVAERVSQRNQPPAPVTEKDPLEGFNAEDRRYLQVVQHLAQSNPAYASRDLMKEVTSFWKQEEEYIARWKKENPGEEFDDKAPEHRSFYRNEPHIPSSDFEDAKMDLRYQPERQKREELENEVKRLQEQQAAIQAREEAEKIRPIIQQEAWKAEREMVLAVHPEFKDLLENGQITKSAAAKMKESDPEVFEILADYSREMSPVIKELEAITHLSRYTPDPDKSVVVNDRRFYPVREIVAIGTELEERTLARPSKEQIRDGRQFITRGELGQRVRSIQEDARMAPAEKNQRINTLYRRTWTIEPEDIKREVIAQSSAKAKKVIGLLNTRASRVGAKTVQQTSTPELAKTTARTAPVSPAVPGSSADNVATRKRQENPDDERVKNTQRAFFS